MRRLCIFSIYIFKRRVRARQKENKIICWLRTPTVGTDEQFTLTEAFISQRNLSGQQIELEPRQGASDGRNGDVGESAARSNERSRALVVLGNHTTRAGAKSVDKLLEKNMFWSECQHWHTKDARYTWTRWASTGSRLVNAARASP